MRCLFLINPWAGAGLGKKIAAQIEAVSLWPGMHTQVVFTDPARLQHQVRLLSSGLDLLVVAGGDGTISLAAQALSHTSAPPTLVPLPIGTGNDIARALGWWDLWKQGGLEAFVAGMKLGKVKNLDLWALNEEYSFMAYAGLGADAWIVREVYQLRKRSDMLTKGELWNRFLYLVKGIDFGLSCLTKGNGTCARVLIEAKDGNTHSLQLRYSGCMICANIAYYSGGGRLHPLVKFDDGLLEVYYLPTFRHFLSFILKLRLGKCKDPDFRATSVKIQPLEPVTGQLDGEWIGPLSPKRHLEIKQLRSMPVLIAPKGPLRAQKVKTEKELSYLNIEASSSAS